MMQRIKPDWHIIVGVKDGRVVDCDFADGIPFTVDLDNSQRSKFIARLLSDAANVVEFAQKGTPHAK